MVSPQLPATYEDAQKQHLRFYSRVTCIVTIVLILSGVGLDAAFYPQYRSEFAVARVLVAVLILATLLSYWTPFGERNIRGLTYVWIALPQLMIAWMIFHSDGERSIYFVGLTFAISGIGFFLPLSIIEALLFSLSTLAMYVVACMARPSGVQETMVFLGQIMFILFYGLISVVISVYSGRWRLRAYRLQSEVQDKNEELLEKNRLLAEVKGQLLQREKMAAIGTLSAGLLHELNNPVNYSLMAINMGLTCKGAQSDEMLKESLVDAREGMQRIQNIVTDLKTFAYQKPGQDSMRPFLLENAVRSAVRLAGYELKGIDVAIALPQDSHVLGDEPAIIGVLINLLSNAALALQVAKREQPRIAVTVEPKGQRLGVSVRDNGSGIDPANLTRVFEPFFTTRDVGAGLGLGLSVSYGIVQRHGGTLAVESELGSWTEFTFDLPRPE
ncbi:MAG: two-component sensor histidine kinase [Hydrogenophaga sp.]|uniref:sensor histidine kinase n=1 Tax=Hydrogenophaga sp. TaxID=1904254 RepID=UPI00260E8EE8|nr:ATP-binding protein [Hydrogenophaga sp.]MCW5670389.1 two-component sensor histidine kinase [Hydrogenophaga sp.]